MKLNLPQPPTAVETEFVAIAVRKAAREVADLEPLWEAANRAKRETTDLASALEKRRVFAEACAKFVRENAGNLVSRKDGRGFGALTGKGVQRRTLIYPVLGHHGPTTADRVVYAIAPGEWCERQDKHYSDAGNTWVEVTE